MITKNYIMLSRQEKRKETSKRRKTLSCRTIECKVDKSHLNKATTEHLNRLFLEAKWYTNYCLQDIKLANYKIKEVPIKVKDIYENRELKHLTSMMKQDIKAKIITNCKILKKKKQKGQKIGKLKFKKEITSIPLRQLNNSYYINENKTKIRIQGLKTWIRVRGLKQIPEGTEIANAHLIKENDDFYIKIVTYSPRQEKCKNHASIGIDFGCESQLSFSNDLKIQFEVPVTKKIKKLDRKISRKNRKDSKNRRKDQKKRKKEYKKITNKKKDIRDKVVNAITTSYKYVCFQDESINAWKAGNHGKKIQNTAIGAILTDLRSKSVTPLVVDKYFPSTKLCFCGNKQKLKLSERTFKCKVCGFTQDRDIKAACLIEQEALKQVPTDHRELCCLDNKKLGENLTSTLFNKLNRISGVKVVQVGSRNQEASF